MKNSRTKLQRLEVLSVVSKSTMNAAQGEHPQHGAVALGVDRKVQDVAVGAVVLRGVMAALNPKQTLQTPDFVQTKA